MGVLLIILFVMVLGAELLEDICEIIGAIIFYIFIFPIMEIKEKVEERKKIKKRGRVNDNSKSR